MKILIITILTINFLFASTLKDLNITDNDFLNILHSSKKNIILDRINDLILLKKSLKDVDDNYTKLHSVNDFFNEFKFRSDMTVYKKVDYWATRKEFIFKGKGDCEDFVIAKYFTLLELGIEESKLSLLHNIRKNDYHLVLAYQEDTFSDVLILDNINKEILPLTQRNDILVLYTLKTIDTQTQKNISLDLQTLNNYKWTKIYLKSTNRKKVKLLIN
jgi:predicted transglutaminase-like cysteine proteinase